MYTFEKIIKPKFSFIMNIFCGSLPFSLTEAELRNLFEAHGEITSVKIITDRATGRSKGFGFVEMPEDEEANAAIEALNGSDVGGRNIVVNKAEERRENNRGGGNFRGGNRGGYNKGGNRGAGQRGGYGHGGRRDEDFNY